MNDGIPDEYSFEGRIQQLKDRVDVAEKAVIHYQNVEKQLERQIEEERKRTAFGDERYTQEIKAQQRVIDTLTKIIENAMTGGCSERVEDYD